MNKKSFIKMIGAATLLLGLGLNLQYALDDYGFTKNSLNGFMHLQASDPASGNQQKGKSDVQDVTCKVTVTTTTTNSSNSSNTKSVSGEASGSVFGVGAKASGKTDTTKGSGESETETKTVEKVFQAKLYLCYPGNDACTRYDPCY